MWRRRLALASLAVTLIGVTSVAAVTDYNAYGTDCWETCFLDAFQESPDKNEQKRLQDFLKLINKVKQIRIKYQINSTLLTVDSTVRRNHAFDYDHAGIFHFQQHLASLLVLAMPAWTGNPAYHSQFDGEQAWYCNNWSCNSRCTAIENILYDFEDVLESSEAGLIEDGCHLGRKALQHDDCNNYRFRNPLLIAVVNSEFDDRHNKKQRSAHSSSCRKYRHRLVVGTHASEWRQMKDFASTTDSAFYIEDTPENKKTLASLIDCMQLECCLSAPRPTATKAICLRTVAGYDVDEFRVKLPSTTSG